MALLYPIRTTFDTVIDLDAKDANGNLTNIRTYNGASISGKHVKVIPSKSIDNRRGLLFDGAASVTIVGGHFMPPLKGYAQYPSGDRGDGYFTMTKCGELYLEGVLLDNINAGHYVDGIYISAFDKNTKVYLQNCRFQNVQGIELDLDEPTSPVNRQRFWHCDICQMASQTQGRSQFLKVYNCTFTCDYQGFFLDKQTTTATDRPQPEIMDGVWMERVNFWRAPAVVTPYPKHYYWISHNADYATYWPVRLKDCWSARTATIVGDVRESVWPSTRTFTTDTATFPDGSVGLAELVTEPGAGGRTYVHWPNLTAAGREFSDGGTGTAKVFQGLPPGGDFVKETDVGLGYVQGTDLTTGVVPTTEFDSLKPRRFFAVGSPTHVNFQRTTAGSAVITEIGIDIIPDGQWTASGPGTIASSSASAVAVTPTTGQTTARRTFATVPAKSYRISFSASGTIGTYAVGTTATSADLVPDRAMVLDDGQGTPELTQITFQAPTTVCHIRLISAATGTMTITSLSLTELAQFTWFGSGVGTVTEIDATSAILSTPGGDITIARRTFSTIPGIVYTITFTISPSTVGVVYFVGSQELEADLIAPVPNTFNTVTTAQFTATTDTTHFHVQRTGAATLTISGVAITRITPTVWTGAGPGTVQEFTPDVIAITGAGGTPTTARRSFGTLDGHKYRFNATFSGNIGNARIGTTSGGQEYLGPSNTVVGANPFDFVAAGTLTYVQLERTSTGTATISSITMTETSGNAWFSSGAGATITDNSLVSLQPTSATVVFVQRPFLTTNNREYTLSYEQAGGVANRAVGTVSGAADVSPLSQTAVGAVSLRLKAASRQTWVRFEKAGASTTPVAFSEIVLTLLPFDASENWTTNGNVTVAADQSVTSIGAGAWSRRSYNTVSGLTYRLQWTNSAVTVQYRLGTTEGGFEIRDYTVTANAVNFTFVAASSTTFLEIFRAASGTVTYTKPVMSLV